MNVLTRKMAKVRQKASALVDAVNDLEKHLDRDPLEEKKEKNFLTLYEAADRLGLHYNTIRRYVMEGKLQAQKLGTRYYVNPADLPGFELNEKK